MGQILFDQREDGDFPQIDLLRPGQREKKIERSFPAFEADVQHVFAWLRRRDEEVVHGSGGSLARGLREE